MRGTGKGKGGAASQTERSGGTGWFQRPAEPACHLSLSICPKDSSCEKGRLGEALKGVDGNCCAEQVTMEEEKAVCSSWWRTLLCC